MESYSDKSIEIVVRVHITKCQDKIVQPKPQCSDKTRGRNGGTSQPCSLKWEPTSYYEFWVLCVYGRCGNIWRGDKTSVLVSSALNRDTSLAALLILPIKCLLVSFALLKIYRNVWFTYKCVDTYLCIWVKYANVWKLHWYWNGFRKYQIVRVS